MHFVATKRQPFSNCAHDSQLVLNICNGIRPEINDMGQKHGILHYLMRKCWDPNPKNGLNVIELLDSLWPISFSGLHKAEIEKAENYRSLHLSSLKGIRHRTTHSQAFYTSRLLNPFTKDLPTGNNSECLDCAI